MKLIKYDAACRAIALATRVDEAKAIRDKAVAMQAYARQAKSTELFDCATELRYRAERRAGVLLDEMDKRGERHKGKAAKGSRVGTPTEKPKLSDLGVSKTQSNRWRLLAKMSDYAFEALVGDAKRNVVATAGAIQVRADKKARRVHRERELGIKQQALPERRYGVILADPEWRFEPWSRESGMDRAADNHYPTSTLEVIRSRHVHLIAADDCVLFLWATVPMLPNALGVMAAWGFEYRSHFVWAKDRIGTGYWNRNKHELLLVGAKGNIPAPAPGMQWDSVVEAAVGEHSVKPKCFLEMIDAYFPTLPKIELNCRGQPWSGWDAWGNELESAA
jgi:N6-adenosine-specific RNA methylase IME4